MRISVWLPLLGFLAVVDCLSDSHRKVALERYREMLAKGKALNNDQKALPKGKNIYKLNYDEEAEKAAQEWADGCVFEHSPKEQRKNAGQSLFAVMPAEKTPSRPKKALITATDKWWSELAEFGLQSPDLNFTMDQFNKGIGHWSQLVWAKTYRVGCGVKFCADKPMTYVVCNYFPPGNMINSKIYEQGDACQKDDECTTYEASKCEKETGLCIAK
uniref:SCP domain-containing protein n=1 Tax=Ditylenchus dipsaci TaxID=166011 RepID=A0A915EMC4_9BILA